MPKNTDETTDQAAAIAEAKPVEDATMKFSFDGVEYEVRADIFDDIDFREHLEDGDHTLVARALLGARQWAEFKQKHRKRQTAVELINAWGDAAGLGK